ncbi:MAG TPA: M15 family metallopeptidase [Actinomycetota bacterium]|nr:M15 family metallopeptidase [Actinomycetota bacterium]
MPALFVIVVALLAIGIMLLQVGRATDIRAEGVTAADAGALAGAKNMRIQLIAITAAIGYPDPDLVNQAAVCATAAAYVARNGATMTGCRQMGYQVHVDVRMNRGLTGERARSMGLEGDTATAEATAEVRLFYTLGGLGGGGGGILSATGGGLSPGALRSLADDAGVDVPRNSSLMHSQPCNVGADTVNLSREMKIAILRAEALLGHPLSITDGFRTYACQASIPSSANPGGRVAAPGRSLHNYGMAIDAANYGELARVAARVGLCQPFPGADDDPFHFSISSGPECAGRGGPLGQGGAFGGLAGVASFVTFDVILVE